MTDIDLTSLTPEQKRALLAERLRRKSAQRPPARERRFSASFPQQRMWFLDRLNPGSAAYNIPAALRVHGPLDVEIWRRGLAEIVRRHESLRTTFEEADGEPVQVVHPTGEIELAVEPCEHLRGPEGERGIEELARREFARPFDLGTGPLMRMKFLRLAPDEHVLLLTMHHIVADLWSTSVLFGELVTLYQSHLRGAAAELPELPVQYADYAAWQRKQLAGPGFAAELDYWAKTLDGAAPILELPTDRPRPAVLGSSGGSRPFRLPAAVMNGVRELSRRAGVTPFMTLLAAYVALLHRYSRQEDVVVGVPVANRGQAQVEQLIGYFVNTLAIRNDVSGNPTFTELLARVRGAALGAFAHQELPFERLVEELRPERDLSRSPLFQVSFVYQNIPVPEFGAGGLRLELMDVPSSTARFDLELQVFEQGDTLGGWFEYNTDLFDAATVDRMGGHLAVLLDNVLRDPDQPILDIPLLTAAEQAAQDQERADTRVEWPDDLLTHQRVERQAALRPDAEAVHCRGQSLTYAELDAAANRLARRLRDHGVSRDVLVGVCLERSLDMVVAVLAVLKAGGAYVPVDPQLPRDRIAFMTKDAGLPVIITQSSVAVGLPRSAATTLCVDELRAELAAESAAPLDAPVDGEALAYVIYTSGSTGRPKGVQLPHRALRNLFRAMKQWPGIDSGDSLLAVTTLSFDIATLELLLPLVEGARVVLATREVATDGKLLAAEMAATGATMMQATPSTWRMLLDAGWPGRPGLRGLICGEALPPDVARRLLDGGVELWNMYGPSETTIYSLGTRIVDETITIGRPIANTEIHILDAEGRPVPSGVPGELCIGGSGLARGYLNRPELTERQFIRNPFTSGADDRLYRTGDLVRRRVDGTIDYLGRLDHQVKLRGYRIELGEIESVLMRQDQVTDTVVVVREDQPGDHRLVAYAVPAESAGAGDDLRRRLRSALAEKLPDYMVPSAFVFLDALPLTPSGKTDRGALPVPEGQESRTAATYVAPRDSSEEALCDLFAEVLTVPRVGIDDGFFALGGHSLLATRLVARIRATLRVELPVRALFEKQSVAELAELVRQGGGDARPALRPATRPDPLPLSFAQRRLWFLHEMEGPSPTYNLPVVLRLTGALDVGCLRAALADVVARHESLRTVFPDTGGAARQHILPPDRARPALPVTDIAEAGLDDAVARAVRHCFDLTREIPLHAELFTTGADAYVLAVVVHHIAADGWSLAPLRHDLAAAYRARRAGHAPAWEPLPVQYADYALWQRRHLGQQDDPESVWSRQLAHWREALEGMPERIALPVDRPHPAEASHRGETVTFQWGPDLHAGLGRLARGCDVSMFMVLDTALAVLLNRLGAGEDIPIGVANAGRDDEATEQLIGFFANTLVLRNRIARGQTFRQLLAEVREQTLEALAHQDIPFESLVDSLRPSRSMSHHPLVQVMLSWQSATDETLELPGVEAAPLVMSTGTARMDLVLLLHERLTAEGTARGIDGGIEYNADVFDPQTVRTMLGRLRQVVLAMIADPDQPIGDVDVLTPAERHRVLEEWNGSGGTEQVAGLPELFEAQAARTPDAVAVSGGDERLTYAELSRATDRLAARLRALGVGAEGAEDAVCLLMERSVRVPVAILAVLKAGGVYVPLDTRYPRSRMRLIMEESGADVLLVDGDGTEHPAVDGMRVLDVGAEPAADTMDGPGHAPPPPGGPDRLAYLMFTSGSTGRPKGVAVTHGNVASLAADHAWRNGNHSRVLMHAPSAFDASTYELWVPLLSGGEVVVAPAGELDPDVLLRTIRERDVTSAFFTAALFNLLVEYDATALAGMREVLAGGEALSPPVVARALAAWRGTVLTNGYGPTETTTFAVLHSMSEVTDGTVPIGTPMDDTRAYVLDERLRPAPVGVPGELYLAGRGLARGYFANPGLTAQRFVACPYGAPGERMYRTGDLARRRADSTIEYLGRTDDQVKIRGFRIEPGEIESALGAHEAVADAAVLVHDKPSGGKDLVGYVVPADGATADPAELRSFVAERLPQYMVPVAVLVLDAFPMTANGKLDRRALPVPDLNAAAGSRAARTPAERTLCAVFARVLGLPEVGAEAGFFDLGGDSIQATQLVAQSRTAGLVFTVRDVFTHQTAAGIAQVARPADEEAATAVADVGTGAIAALPVLERQRLLGGSPVGFDLSATVGLPTGIDEAGLTATLQAVVDTHDALRTRLVTGPDGRWSLHAAAAGAPRIADILRRVDITGLDEADRHTLITEETTAAKRRLDPAAGAMLQPVWFDAGPERAGRLLLAVHHFAVDGVSWRILLSDVAAAWEAVSAGHPPALAPVTTSLRGWAEQIATGSAVARHRPELPVWQDVLRDTEPLVAGELDPERDVTGTEGRLSVTLSAEDCAPLLAEAPAALRSSIQDVLLTALGLAVRRWRSRPGGPAAPGEGAVVLDVESHGRHEHLADGADLSRTVGWFTSVHPVRLDAPALPWRHITRGGDELAAAVVRTGECLRAVPDNGLGFGLLRYLDPRTAPQLAALPAPQLLFNYLGRVPVTDEERPWLPLRDDTAPGTSGLRPLSHPLEVNAITQDGPDGPRLVANWTWASSLLGEDEVRDLADAWFDALRALTRCAAGVRNGAVTLPRRKDTPAAAFGAADLLTAPIPRADHGQGAGLSFGQLEFLLQPVGPNHAHHAVITAFRVRGELDATALRRALDDLVRRHDILRTRYVQQGSATRQFADGRPQWPLDTVELRAFAEAEQRERLHALLTAETKKTFRIEDGDLVRGLLVRLADQEHALVLVAHHILVDHWGFLVVFDELAKLYEAHAAGRPPRLPEVMVQHLDYAAWEQGLLAEGALDEHIEHWRTELDGAARTLDFEAPPHQLDDFIEGFSCSVVVDAEVMTAVKEAARREGVTLFMMLMSAFHVLLHSYSGATDIAVSHPLAGRERPETESMVGPFINIILNRSRMADDPTFHELVQRVLQGELDAYSHQNVPVRALVHDGIVGDGNQLPLRVMLNLLGVPAKTLTLPGLEVAPLDVRVGDVTPLPELITAIEPHNLDLYLVARDVEGELHGLWVYSPHSIAPPVMGALVRQWPRVLELVARHPELTVSQLRERLRSEQDAAPGRDGHR
ncbi:non-ribosomal peptide synthetase [Streptomyces sp. A1499]|uniref:non-ribosomal peptide synthetase n=1 Tax=Streptomyces sp. A1499 TaxID=2563104 RepID=UPI00109E42D8|nr:non-ribosomal peptide synthetase [Streptomyces sp. A1499]THC44765.1 amino acid adenylation domain-containing protein [Streptomyces sp. A1499]